MKIDLDRLHKVASCELSGRQVGKTLLTCCELASLVCLGERFIVAKVKNFEQVFYLSYMINNVFKFYDIEITKATRDSLIGINWKVIFIPEMSFERKIRGLNEFVLVDFIDF